MAKRPSLNLSETIREYRESHRGVRAMDAFAAIKKGHPRPASDASHEYVAEPFTFWSAL